MRRNVVVLGLALAALWWASPASADSTTREATLNVLRTNPAHDVADDIGLAMRHASVVRLQEVEQPASRAGVRLALRRAPSWRATWRLPEGPFGDAIVWDSRVWEGIGYARYRLVHHGVDGLTPDRWLVWKLLRLRATGTLVTIANVHAVSGYCSGRPDRAVRARFTRDYWRTVERWTRRQLGAHPDRALLLGGDLNCQLSQRSEPWLPGRALRGLYSFDRLGYYDHLLTARGRVRPSGLGHRSLPANSDHDVYVRRLRFPG